MSNERALEPVGSTFNIGGLGLALKSIQPIGVDGGDPIDVTTLTNTLWVTKQPQALQEVPDFSFTCQYYPDDWNTIVSEVNSNQALSITLSDGKILSFWCYLRTFEPKEAGKGEEWQATGTVVVTNMDNSGVEQAPTCT